MTNTAIQILYLINCSIYNNEIRSPQRLLQWVSISHLLYKTLFKNKYVLKDTPAVISRPSDTVSR